MQVPPKSLVLGFAILLVGITFSNLGYAFEIPALAAAVVGFGLAAYSVKG